jgi:hypothetical protein
LEEFGKWEGYFHCSCELALATHFAGHWSGALNVILFDAVTWWHGGGRDGRLLVGVKKLQPFYSKA